MLLNLILLPIYGLI